MIKAVTFDCWGTLIADRDMGPALERRAAAIAEAASGALTIDEARALGDKAWQVHHDAWERHEQYGSPGMARLIAHELALAEGLIEGLTLALEEASLLGHVEALPGAADTLRALREAGVRTALVCDTGFTPGRIVRKFLEEAGVAEHLEFLAFSNEVGVPKPDPRIFLHALEAIGAAPSESAHVGDLLRTDVAGARAVGMKTVRITAVNERGTSAGLGGPLHGKIAEPDALPDDADEVAASHAELLDALRRLGAPL